MPIALVVAGAVLILVGVRGTYTDFATTLKGEFVGQGNYGYRAAAILMIGVIGYAGDSWRKLSVALLILMTVGLMVSKDQGFFAQLGKGVSAAPVKPVADTSVTGGAANITPASSTALDTGAALLKAAALLL